MESNKTQTTIGGRIKGLREAAHLTQEALASQLYISREKVNMWENGTRMIKGEDIASLADALKTTCDYLLRGVSSDQLDIYDVTALSPGAILQLKNTSQQNRHKWGRVLSDLITNPWILDALHAYLYNDIDSVGKWNGSPNDKFEGVPPDEYERVVALADSKHEKFVFADPAILEDAILLKAEGDIRRIKERRKEAERNGKH